MNRMVQSPEPCGAFVPSHHWYQRLKQINSYREGVKENPQKSLTNLVSSTDEFCCSYIILSGLSTALGTRKMPQRVTLSGSLTSSWRDWPPKEEWPEVATSGQLPASRVVLSAVLPNSLLINLCCLAQSSPSGWVCICAHYSRRIAMPPVGSRLYSKHPQSHRHWPTMATKPNQFCEPRLKDRALSVCWILTVTWHGQRL